MDEARRYKSLLIIFILILLIHSIALWIIFIASFDRQHPLDTAIAPATSSEEQIVQPPQKTPWKALQAKPSAQVLFKNTQPNQNTSTPNDSSAVTQQPPVTATPQQDPSPTAQPLPLAKPLITDNKGRISTHVKKEEQEQKKSEEPPIKEPLPDQKNESEKTAVKNPPLPTNSPLKKFSFNTLAQGFAQHMHDQGKDEYTMRGAQKGKATAEQLKYAQYGSKICNTLTNAFVTNKHKILFTSYAKRDALIKIVINKDGSLNDVVVLKSSTVPSIDLSIVNIIKEASQGFPPLPEFFAMDQFPFTIIFNDTMHIIEHPEQSHWSL